MSPPRNSPSRPRESGRTPSPVDLNDLRRYMAERGTGHAHEVPGTWDWDNGEAAHQPCTLCATYLRLLAAVGGPQTLPRKVKP